MACGRRIAHLNESKEATPLWLLLPMRVRNPFINDIFAFGEYYIRY
jgi:hypothetical protein